MTRLIRENLARLWKSKPFWVCAILSLALAVVNSIELNPNDTSWMYKTGSMIIAGGANVIIFASIFSALFLGTDYACGTIRNKLAVGHSRADVYLSSLITTITGTLIITAVYMVPSVFKALVWGKELGMPTNEFILDITIFVCAMIAFSAIYTLLGMLISEKSLTTTFTIVLSMVMLIGAIVLMEFLNQPEYVQNVEMTENGMEMTEPEPNPAYIKPGIKRDIMTAIVDVLPGGQLMNLEGNQLHNPELYPLYSFGVFAVSTAAGVLIFSRKDLK